MHSWHMERFLFSFGMSRLHGLFVGFFKLLQISKNLSSMFIEKNPYTSGPVQFTPMLIKGELYSF